MGVLFFFSLFFFQFSEGASLAIHPKQYLSGDRLSLQGRVLVGLEVYGV